jgi:hypothetical protein
MAQKKDYCNATCICFSSLLFISIIIGFCVPISEIIVGFNFYNKTTCYSFFDIGMWFIIKGFITINFLICISVYLYFNDNDIRSNLCINSTVAFFSLINLIWLIFGSILFWGYCYNLEPKEINIFMWFSLIFGYLTFLKSFLNN